MAFITVREALELPELHNLEVLAGEGGLDRELRNVTVLEVPDPMFWIKEGDLLLTAFYGLRGDTSAQPLLARRVAHLASGICFNPGPGITLSPELLEVADEVALPVLKMPGDMPYAKVISCVLQAILNRQAYLLSRSTEISSMMIKAILNGAEAKEIVCTLARLVKSPVALLDASLNLVADDPYSEGGGSIIEEGLPRLLGLDVFKKKRQPEESPIFVSLNVRGQEVRVGIQVVMIKSSVYGYLTAWEALKRFDEVDSYAISHASTAIALDFIGKISMAEQRQKMVSDLCEDLLSGNFPREESVLKRGEVLALDVSRLNMVVVVRAGAPEGHIIEHLKAGGLHGESNGFVAEVRSIVESRFPDCLISNRSDGIVIALGAGQYPECKRAVLALASEVRAVCQRFLGKKDVLVGVGGVARSLGDLPLSYSQARAAIKVAQCLADGRTEVAFDDMGVYRLLWGIPYTPEVRRYVEMVLPRAGECEANVLDTLEVYLECQKSVSKASRRLYVHPNTVKYRVKKAREFWGDRILEDKNCTDTLIALKLRKFPCGNSLD